MKRLILFLIPFLFSSCREDEIIKPEFFLCAEIDGVNILFEHPFGSLGNRFISEYNSLIFEMAVDQEGVGQRFEIFIRDLPLQNLSFPYTLSLTPINSTINQPFMFMRYREAEEFNYTTGSTSRSDLSLTLSGYQDGILTGSFSGTLPFTRSEEITRSISNGSFRIEINNQ